ncbi:hypothetical protein ACLOJK_008755 [Asimina triloba]
MSIIPFFGRQTPFDPISFDLSNPFGFGGGFPSSTALTPSPEAREAAVFANAQIDWKETPEAHIFKADLPGLNKEEVKVEMEEGNILQIRGERSREV